MRRSLISKIKSDSGAGQQLAFSPQGVFYGWIILLVSFVASLVGFGVYYAFGVFFSDLQQAFSANRADVSLISSICIGTILSSGVVYGWAVDRYGPRIPIALGGIVAFAGLMLASHASHLWQLYLSLGFLVGLGTGATTVPTISALSHWFVKMRGFVIGIASAGAAAGMMVIAPLSQHLLSCYGWRATFTLLGVVYLIIFGICAFLIRGDPSEKGMLPYGATESSKDVALEKTSLQTSIEPEFSVRDAIRSSKSWLIMGIKMVLPVVTFMVNTHLVNFAKDAGVPAQSAAMLMTVVGAVSIAAKIGAGHLADKVGSCIIVIVCSAVMVGQMLYFASPRGAKFLPVSAVIYGMMYGGTFPVLNIIVTETFGLKQLGKTLGLLNVAGAIGSLIGPWLGGYIFDTAGSYSIAFIVAAGCSAISVILAILLEKRTRKEALPQH